MYMCIHVWVCTKFILDDYSSDYKLRLTRLHLLPLLMQLEVNDITFFVKNLKDPSQSFNVKDYVHFCSAGTSPFTFLKLKQQMFKLNCVKHLYFNRLPRLWNSLPLMDLNQPQIQLKLI